MEETGKYFCGEICLSEGGMREEDNKDSCWERLGRCGPEDCPRGAEWEQAQASSGHGVSGCPGECERSPQPVSCLGPPVTARLEHTPPALRRENSRKLQEEGITFNRSPGLQTHIPSRIFNCYLRRLLRTRIRETIARGLDGALPDPPQPQSLEVSVSGLRSSVLPGGDTEDICGKVVPMTFNTL